MSVFSLPTQRCFLIFIREFRLGNLFSAYAEVFPPLGKLIPSFSSFLCLRRGVSLILFVRSASGNFSLPTQRCFRNDAAPCFAITTFLCLRRGVSIRNLMSESLVPLFSAYAEVFPGPLSWIKSMVTFLCLRRGVSGENIGSTTATLAFLCLRRGVSFSTLNFLLKGSFSLPTQRCFHPR